MDNEFPSPITSGTVIAESSTNQYIWRKGVKDATGNHHPGSISFTEMGMQTEETLAIREEELVGFSCLKERCDMLQGCLLMMEDDSKFQFVRSKYSL
jgi:hypothetical protein